MRSKLFVPGSRPELFAKALASDADAISIDLEDSVAESRKDEARAYVSEFLQSDEVVTSNKVIIVRCNALCTAHFEADLLALAQPTVELVNLPKVESAADVRLAAEALKQAEESNAVAEPIGILATIESPAGLRRASKIASAHSRVDGLQLGLNDLFESLSIDRKETANVHAAMFAMRLAAGEADVFAFDGAFADLQDDKGFREEAAMARRLGYQGKSCIHPSQVAMINEEFLPSADDIGYALRVLEAYRQAETDGVGAFTVDGKMVDRPAIRRAKELVATRRRP